MTEFIEIHHVQLTVPRDGTTEARRFYGEVMGLTEVPIPPTLAGRATAWFRSGSVEVHITVEEDFRPVRKGHPAIRVTGLDALAHRCEAAGFDVRFDDAFPGFRRFHVHDPFGNRLEFMEALTEVR